MKLIFIDFAKRATPWWIGLGLAVLVFEACARAGFLWTGILVVPFALEFSRGSSTALALLPVDRRALARCYWLCGVVAPVAIVTGIAAVVGIFEPGWAALRHLLITLVVSFGVAGSSYCLLTFVPTLSETDTESFSGSVIGVVWFPAMMTGLLFGKFQRLPELYSVAIVACLLVLTVVGFFRSGHLVQLHARTRKVAKTVGYFPAWGRKVAPGRAGFSTMFLKLAWQALFSAGLIALLTVSFRMKDFTSWFVPLGIVSIMSLDSGSLRQLRLLPLSTRHLALLCVSAPCFVLLLSAGLLAALQMIGLIMIFPAHPIGSLLWLIGGVSIAASAQLHFGMGGRLCGMILLGIGGPIVASIAVLVPAIIGGLIGVLVAFYWNQFALRSSYTYRVSRTAWAS